jgi:diguanylate cyclase (GGDEF)-like protein/PAS domain S-box-containing protein
MQSSHMQKNKKTKNHLLKELTKLQDRVNELEKLESEHRKNEESLRENESYLKAIIASIQAGVMVIDAEKHEIVDANETACELIGVSKENIKGKICHKYVCPAARGKCPITDLKQVIDNSERLLIDTKGNKIPIIKTVVPITMKNRTYLLESFIDITDRKRMDEQIQKLAITDSLTQAYNRTKFESILDTELERSKRYHQPLSMILFDIDHFKVINDTYGHVVGDNVLKTLTQIVTKNLRAIDSLARWGGEEFIILAPGTGIKRAQVLAERIRKAIEGHRFHDVGKVTISSGVTEFTLHDTKDSFIKRADDTMYKAKKKGRNRVEVCIAR